MLKSNIFLAALLRYDSAVALTQKISTCEAKRSPLIKVQWNHASDLHVTVGFISLVAEEEIRKIALAFLSLSQESPFLASVKSIRVYGNAIVLQVEPYQRFYDIHKKMNQKLIEVTQNRYSFRQHTHFDPHLTIGRVKNVPQLNASHKSQFMRLMEEQFGQESFLIQQYALLRRRSEQTPPDYEVLQHYLLK